MGSAALALLGSLGPARGAAAQGKPVMVVESVQMPAWAGGDSQRRPLAPGDTVTTADEVQTAPTAGLVLRLADGSRIRLGEKTRLGIQRLEVPAGGASVRAELKLADGFFRFVTAAAARAVGTRQIDVTLRTATIGIRGTDIWAMTDAAHDAACLFEGKVSLATRDQGRLALDKPHAFWARFFDRPPQPVGVATQEELARFKASSAMRPGWGIAVAGGRWRVVATSTTARETATSLHMRLVAEGYPAVIKAKPGAKGVLEVRINGLSTREDAAAVLEKIAGIEGVQGRVALSA